MRVKITSNQILYCSSCKVPVILARFQLNLDFIYVFSKNAQIWNPMEICPVGAEFYHADVQTDRHVAASHSFANAPKSNSSLFSFKNNRPIAVSDEFLLIGYVCIGRSFWGRRIPNVGNLCSLDEIRCPCLCKYPVNSQNMFMLISHKIVRHCQPKSLMIFWRPAKMIHS